MDQLQINDIIGRIDSSLGEELPFSSGSLSENDVEVLQRVFGDVGYQEYLDDQAHRQIIRVYFTNAVILGYLPENRIESYSKQLQTSEGRAALSLHILMNAIEDADKIPRESQPESLTQLRPEPGSPPHLKLIPR